MMKTKSPLALGLAVFLSLVIAVPADLSADPQAAGQPAGHVDRVLPAASIVRGPKTISASVKTTVDWLDLVNTQASGRARVALDDGSVLNVGSDSSVKVTKVDAGAQQTTLDLAYGKLRTQAQKIAKPDGKFEVKTAAGVAGVVGTDFYVGYQNDVMNVVVYEGLVRVCNNAGVCVIVKAGQMTNVRHSSDNSAPDPPTQAPLDLLVSLSKDTDVGPRPGSGVETGGIGKGLGITIGVLAVIPIVILSVLATRPSKPPAPVNPCVINPSSCD